MMSDNQHFEAFVKKQVAKRSNSSPSPLCLVHGTDAYTLRTILNDGKIIPYRCEIVGETVIYVFYGRPAYRGKDARKPVYQKLNAPVYILLDPQLLADGVTGFPFDSGAFHNGLLKKYVPPQLELNHFRFNPSLESSAALVECYFENNRRYLLNNPLAITSVPEGAFEAKALESVLARRNVDDSLDDRASTIEIGLEHPIEITSRNIKAVFLPEDFADDEDIGAKLKEKNIIPYFYDFSSGQSWDNYVALVRDMAKKFYEKSGML